MRSVEFNSFCFCRYTIKLMNSFISIIKKIKTLSGMLNWRIKFINVPNKLPIKKPKNRSNKKDKKFSFNLFNFLIKKLKILFN